MNSTPGSSRRDDRLDLWRETLGMRGIPTTGNDEDFWDEQLPMLIGWGRGEIARRLAIAGSINTAAISKWRSRMVFSITSRSLNG